MDRETPTANGTVATEQTISIQHAEQLYALTLNDSTFFYFAKERLFLERRAWSPGFGGFACRLSYSIMRLPPCENCLG